MKISHAALEKDTVKVNSVFMRVTFCRRFLMAYSFVPPVCPGCCF
jgi:hypothetical protein